MKQFLLLLILAGEGHAFISPPDTKCDASQTAILCSPVVGGTVYIKLMTNATGYKLKCLKDGTKIMSLKKGKVDVSDAFKNRTEFSVTTGTLKIINVERNDKGEYKVERFDSNGKNAGDIFFTLQVQENLRLILLIAGIVGVILIVLICFACIWKKHRKCKQSQATAKHIQLEKPSYQV